MKFTEIDQSNDKTKAHESRIYPGWQWAIIQKYREFRCTHGWHQFKNYWGEPLSHCKWCDEKLK